MTQPITRTGIGALAPVESDVAAAKRLFAMALDDNCTDAELRKCVTRQSLFELIVYVSDFNKGLRASINQAKSKIQATAAKDRAIALLHSWLDANIEKYPNKLDQCAEDATGIPGLGKSIYWIRKEITEYCKRH